MSTRDHSEASRTLEQARAAKKAAQSVFARLAKGAAIGITRRGRGYGLKVNVPHPLRADAVAPTEIGGVPVKIEVVGPIRKRAA
jgi:hypothetical protein